MTRTAGNPEAASTQRRDGGSSDASRGQASEGDRPAGRVLADQAVSDKLEGTIFDIASQLNRGAQRITSDDERRRVAELNLLAGNRARAASAFASALTYFTFGRSLLDDECWQTQRPLVFELELRRAESELLTGALASAETLLSELSTRAREQVERAAVACLRSTLYSNLDQSDRAMAVCLEYLREAGVDLPRQPSDDEIRAERDRMWSLFGSRPIEALLDLPAMSNATFRATMDVLVQLSLPATYTSNNLLAMILLRMTNISLEHGNCDGSCFAYSNLQLVMGERFGDFRGGFRFGKVSADLCDRGLNRFEARAFTVFSCEIVWTHHVREVGALARRAYRAATQACDIIYASFSLCSRALALLAGGEPLESVQREAEAGVLHAKSVRFGLGGDFLNGIARLVRGLRGLTPNFTSLDDADFHELGFEQRLREDPRLFAALRAFSIRKLQARFFAHDYSAAVEVAGTIRRMPVLAEVAIEKFEYAFYAGLAHAAACERAPLPVQPEHRSELARQHETLRRFAETATDNAGCRLALVGAEMARLDGRPLDAEALYEEAIQSAASAGFVQVEAIARECAAHFYAARGLHSISRACLSAARSCYQRWGAEGKVRQLDRLHPELREDPGASRLASSLGQSLEQLDLSAVMKASQTVSSVQLAADALDRAQTELAHVTRVTTLGELAASIAHEVNQPLAAMVANAGASLNWLARPEPDLSLVREALAALIADGDRAGQVLARIRKLLSRSSVAVTPCDMSPVVEGVVPLLRGQLLRDGVRLETSLARDLPRVMGDPVQLQQVILNLVLNAAEASRDIAAERRRVHVRTSVEGPKEAPSVVVAVEDAGVGLGGVEVARLFETFYTSKPTGLGMGLSISRSIVERHGGRLWAEANAAEGATFRFALAGIP